MNEVHGTRAELHRSQANARGELIEAPEQRFARIGRVLCRLMRDECAIVPDEHEVGERAADVDPDTIWRAWQGNGLHAETYLLHQISCSILRSVTAIKPRDKDLQADIE